MREKTNTPASEVVPITPAQIRAARVYLGLKQEELAEEVGLHPMTISLYEKDKNSGRMRVGTAERLIRTLERLGVAFQMDASGRRRLVL